jgi:hypothetical protein
MLPERGFYKPLQGNELRYCRFWVEGKRDKLSDSQPKLRVFSQAIQAFLSGHVASSSSI